LNNPKSLKKVGFWYGVGKGWNRIFSGVSGESQNERKTIENYAKDAILNHMFMGDMKKMIEEFNLSDPEEKIDSETGKITRENKTLEEHRKYIKSKIKLTENVISFLSFLFISLASFLRIFDSLLASFLVLLDSKPCLIPEIICMENNPLR
jgi:hypothetical protein